MTVDTKAVAKVYIPTSLRRMTGGGALVEVEAHTVEEAVSGLLERFSALNPLLVEDNGRLRRFVNVYLNGVDIFTLEGEHTQIGEGDELALIPAVAGGGLA